MAININRNVEDAFYRYKMPRLLAKVEGKGNGIKTVVANMVDIGKALNRPPTYPTKYFGCELGAQTQFDLKNDRYIVNGDHDAAKLQDLLDGFIRKFVLCQECDNPETTLTVKGQKISLACKACGHVTSVDPRHRLTTFVIKNPPEPEAAIIGTVGGADSQATPGKIDKGKRGKNKRGTKEQSGTAVENGNANGTNAPGSVESGDPEGRGSFENNSDEAGEDEDWAVDPDAVEDRQRELIGNMANITMNDDLEKSIDDRMKIFMDFLKAKVKEGGPLDPKLVQTEAERLDVKDEAVLVICRVLFSDAGCLLNEQVVKSNRVLFLRFTAKNDRAQRHLLGGLEQILIDKKDLLPKLPRILETFYDADILEEKQILKWGAKTSSKYVTKEENKEIRAKAEPFLKWLQEAEEESDEGEDDDDGVEIVYDTKAPAKLQPQVSKPGTLATGGASVATVHQQNGAKDDDFDIDDI